MSQSLPPWQVSQEQQPAATERMGIRAKAWGRAGSLLGKATALSGQHTRLDSLTNGLSRAHGFVTSPQQQSFYPGTRSIDSSAPASRIRTFISGAKATRDLNTKTEERCIAFPGYACIRSTPGIPQVEVEVSGFAFRTRPLEHASRTQKVFVKMAQQLSGVKKPSKLASSPRSSLEDSSPPSSAASSVTSFNSGASDVHPSAQDQVWNDLFALSNQNAPDDDVRKALKDLHLTDEPQLLYTPENSPPITPRGSISDLSSVASANQVATPRPGGPQRSSTDNLKHSPLRKPVELPGRTGVSGAVEAANSAFSNLDLNTDEAQMHTNMKERLRAFFSQKLDQRRVRITVYLDEQGKDEKELRCLAKGTVVTAPGGGFKQVVAFPAVLKEDGRCLEGAWLRVTSELLPFADDATGSEAPGRFDCCYAQVVSHDIPRIISDIDDTVKISEVTGGVRRVFRNVFSMPYERVIVQGMSQWYGQMAQKGAALHYVSNGPVRFIGLSFQETMLIFAHSGN